MAFEDTPAWEAGLRVHEAENKWLLREFLAVLGASKSYARSLSGGGVDLGLGDGLGGVLGALAGAGAGALAAGMEGIGLGDGAGADGSDGAVRVGVSAEANFAAALERVGTVAAGTAEEEEMAAPMASSIGAPLLAPIADALRAVGMLRESLGRRVRENLVDNLQCFVDEDLGAFATRKTATSATAPRATRRGSITLRSPPHARPRRPRRRRTSPRRRRRSRRPAPGSRSLRRRSRGGVATSCWKPRARRWSACEGFSRTRARRCAPSIATSPRSRSTRWRPGHRRR